MAKFNVLFCEKIEDTNLFKVAFGVKTDSMPSWFPGTKAWSLSLTELKLNEEETIADDSFELIEQQNENGIFKVIKWK